MKVSGTIVKRVGSSSWLVFAFGMIIGCGGTSSAPQTTGSLQQLAGYIGKYISTQGDRPKNEAALKAFIKSQAPDADIEKMFVSERQGKPFVVVYSNSPVTEVFAYEADSDNGKRYVVMPTTQVQYMDEDAFQRLLKKK